MQSVPASAGTSASQELDLTNNTPVLFITDPEILLPGGTSHWDVKLFTTTVNMPGTERPYSTIYLVFEETKLDGLDGFRFHRLLSEFSKNVGRPVTVTTYSLMGNMYDYRQMNVASSDTYTINGEYGDDDAIHIELVTKDFFVGQMAEGNDPWLTLLCIKLDFEFDFVGITGLDQLPADLRNYLMLEPTHPTFDVTTLMYIDGTGLLVTEHREVGKR